MSEQLDLTHRALDLLVLKAMSVRNFIRNRPVRLFLKSGMAIALLAYPAIARANRIDDVIAAKMKWERIPGLSIAVVRDGKVIGAKGYGIANLETGTEAGTDSVYKVGSDSKQFLAAGLMLLVEEGKVGLDDPLSEYLDGAPESWKSITVRHVLTHTSGIVRESPGFDPLKVQPDADVIRATYGVPLDFAPGAKWEYSNMNYYCVAEIIRKASGEPWSKFIAERIFAPAGMSATRTTTMVDIVPHRASGYMSGERGWENAEVWLALRPSGAFLSTVLDFAKWDEALASDKILSAASRAQMWTPVRLNDGTTYHYGFGWQLDLKEGHRRVHHSGGVPGFVCEFDRYLDDHLSVVIMANVGNRDLEDLAVQIAGMYMPALKPPVTKAIADSEPLRTAEMRGIAEALMKKSVDAPLFTAELGPRVGSQVRRGSYDALAGFGPLRAFDLIARKSIGNNVSYTYRLEYRDISLFIDASFDRDGKIAKFGLYD